MTFRYHPDDANISWPAGDYQATIERVEEKTSSKGDPMLVVHFKAYSPDGHTQNLTEYITNPPKASGRKGNIFKLRQIAIALGAYDDFKLAKFDVEDHTGENIIVTLAQEVSAEYGDQNKIKAYKPYERSGVARSIAEEFVDDPTVPF